MSIPPLGPIVAASAWGARKGPGILRRVLDGGRTWRVVLVTIGSSLFGLLLTAAWVATVLQGVPLLSLVLGLAALCSWAFVAEAVARWWWHPRASRGPVLATAPSGLPSTAWLRSRAAMVRPVALVLVLLLCAVGDAVAGVAGRHAWAFVAPTVLVGLALWLSLPMLTGRATAGGLHLTRQGIEHVWGSSSTVVGWDEARLLGPREAFGLEGSRGLVHERAGWHHQDPVDHVRAPHVAIPVAYLTSPPALVRLLVEEYRGHRALRAELGTRRSLERYASRR